MQWNLLSELRLWPDDTSTELRYGDITVSMVSADEWADYMVRMLKVEKVHISFALYTLQYDKKENIALYRF